MKTKFPARRTLAGLASLTLLGAGSAQAQSTYSPYYIGGSLNYEHQSNMLQIGDGGIVPAGFSRADSIFTTALLGGFDQTFGRQRAYANAIVRDNRYADNTLFNNRSYSASAGLDWSTIERVSGSLTASAARYLQRFNTADIDLLTEKNLESVRDLSSTFSVGMVTAWSFDFGLSHRQVRNSIDLAAVQARTYDQDSGNLALRWSPRASLSLSAGLARTQGRYPKFRTAADGTYEADRFKRNDFFISGVYKASGASQVDFRLNTGRTSYDINRQRDFSGTTGFLNWGWQATGRLRLATSLSRDTGQNSYGQSVTLFTGLPTVQATVDYSQVTEIMRLQADYSVSAKTNLTASAARVERRLVRTTDSTLFENASDKEISARYSLGVRWMPLRTVTTGCDYASDKRKAQGILMVPLHNSTVSCFAQITLLQ